MWCVEALARTDRATSSHQSAASVDGDRAHAPVGSVRPSRSELVAIRSCPEGEASARQHTEPTAFPASAWPACRGLMVVPCAAGGIADPGPGGVGPLSRDAVAVTPGRRADRAAGRNRRLSREGYCQSVGLLPLGLGMSTNAAHSGTAIATAVVCGTAALAPALQVGGRAAGMSRSPVPRIVRKVRSRYSSIRSLGHQRVHDAQAAGDDDIAPLALDGAGDVALDDSRVHPRRRVGQRAEAASFGTADFRPENVSSRPGHRRENNCKVLRPSSMTPSSSVLPSRNLSPATVSGRARTPSRRPGVPPDACGSGGTISSRVMS